MSLLVSVIIPVYNAENFLEKTIGYIQNQTYQNLEIILVNDGSTDRSADICQRIARKDSRIKYIEKENGGICSARNAGLQQATGEWIAFCDDDDKLDLKAFEKAVQAAALSDADVVRFRRRQEVRSADRLISEHVYPEFKSGAFSVDSYEAYQESLKCGYGVWAGLYKREFLTANNIRFDEYVKYGFEDHLFVSQIMASGPRVYCLSDVLYTWIKRKNHSTSEKRGREVVKNRINTLFKWYEIEKKVADCYADREEWNQRKYFIIDFVLSEVSLGEISKKEATELLRIFMKKIELGAPVYNQKKTGNNGKRILKYWGCYLFPGIMVRIRKMLG